MKIKSAPTRIDCARAIRIILIIVTVLAVLMLAGVTVVAWLDNNFVARAAYFIVIPLFVLANVIFLTIAKRHCASWFLLIASTLLSVYVAETWFFFAGVDTRDARYQARRAGVEYDHRHPLEVVADLRHEGRDAYHAMSPVEVWARNPLGVPNALQRGVIEQMNLYPLAGIPQATLVLCNESGHFPTYNSDEHGFNNPLGLYDGTPVDTVLIGDSFTQGWCVDPSENIAGHLQKLKPNLRVANLGISGHGPLLELAVLREYARLLRPARVYWIFFEGNDLKELMLRGKHPVLTQYLHDPGFTQNLAARRDEVSAFLRSVHDSMFASIEGLGKSISSNRNSMIFRLKESRLASFLVLRDLREGVYTAILRTVSDRRSKQLEPDLERAPALGMLEDIFRSAHETVAAWGGELVVVYLPGIQTIVSDELDPQLAQYAKETKAIIERIGLPLIDLSPTFRALDDPLSVLPFRIRNHFNSKGYRIVAEQILEYQKGWPLTSQEYE